MNATIQKTLRRVSASRPFRLFVQAIERLPDRRSNLLCVLTYHRVDHPDARPNLYPGLISATPDEFARQMEFIALRRHVVDLGDVLEAVSGGRPLPPRATLITFDDAYLDFAEHAQPALQRFDLPSTLFVPTAFPDDPRRAFWWDRLHAALTHTPLGRIDVRGVTFSLDSAPRRAAAARSLMRYVKLLPHNDAMALVERVCAQLHWTRIENCVLPWAALRRLAQQRVTLAPHTQTHPLLNRAAPEVAQREAIGSWRDLRREIAGPIPRALAFPAGGHDSPTVDAVRAAGFQLAMTTRRGLNDLNRADPLRLRRINVGQSTSEPLLRAQMLSLTRRLCR